MNEQEALPFQIRRIGGSYAIEDTRIAKTDKTVGFRPTHEDAEAMVSRLKMTVTGTGAKPVATGTK